MQERAAHEARPDRERSCPAPAPIGGGALRGSAAARYRIEVPQPSPWIRSDPLAPAWRTGGMQVNERLAFGGVVPLS